MEFSSDKIRNLGANLNEGETRDAPKLYLKLIRKELIRHAKNKLTILRMYFADPNGEVRATAFQMMATDLDGKLKEGSVYKIVFAKMGRRKGAPYRRSMPIELSFNDMTEVQERTDLEYLNANFKSFPDPVTVDQIDTIAIDTIVDCFCVVEKVGTLFEPTDKTSGRRRLFVRSTTDECDDCTQVTLWGRTAIEIDSAVENTAVCLKGAKIEIYNKDKVLSLGEDGSVIIDRHQNAMKAMMVAKEFASVASRGETSKKKSIMTEGESSTSPRKKEKKMKKMTTE